MALAPNDEAGEVAKCSASNHLATNDKNGCFATTLFSN